MQNIYHKENLIIISVDCNDSVREQYIYSNDVKEQRFRKTLDKKINMYPGFRQIGSFDLDLCDLSFNEILEICSVT